MHGLQSPGKQQGLQSADIDQPLEAKVTLNSYCERYVACFHLTLNLPTKMVVMTQLARLSHDTNSYACLWVLSKMPFSFIFCHPRLLCHILLGKLAKPKPKFKPIHMVRVSLGLGLGQFTSRINSLGARQNVARLISKLLF